MLVLPRPLHPPTRRLSEMKPLSGGCSDEVKGAGEEGQVSARLCSGGWPCQSDWWGRWARASGTSEIHPPGCADILTEAPWGVWGGRLGLTQPSQISVCAWLNVIRMHVCSPRCSPGHQINNLAAGVCKCMFSVLLTFKSTTNTESPAKRTSKKNIEIMTTQEAPVLANDVSPRRTCRNAAPLQVHFFALFCRVTQRSLSVIERITKCCKRFCLICTIDRRSAWS